MRIGSRIFIGAALLLVGLLPPGESGATAQFPDVILYGGRLRALFSNPLESSPRAIRKKVKFRSMSTGCYRGYVARWKIVDDFLYLTAVDPCHGDEPRIPASQLVEGARARIPADWYSGTLRIPDGEQLEYVHGGYASTYERDILLTVDGGKVVETRIVDHFLDGARGDSFGRFNPTPTELDATFHPIEGTGWTTRVREVGAWGDGFYLVGSTGDRFHPQRLLVRLDPDGTSQLHELGNGEIRAASPAPDGGLFLIGDAAPDGDELRIEHVYGSRPDVPWFGHVDASGAMVSERTLLAPGQLVSIASDDRGRIVVAGERTLPDVGASQGWIAELDGTGEVLSQFLAGEDAYHLLFDVAVSSKGTVLAVGARRDEGLEPWIVRRPVASKPPDPQAAADHPWRHLTGVTISDRGTAVAVGRSYHRLARSQAPDHVLVMVLDARGGRMASHVLDGAVFALGDPAFAGDSAVFPVALAVADDEFPSLYLVRVDPARDEPILVRVDPARSVTLGDDHLAAGIVGTSEESVRLLLLDDDETLTWRTLDLPLDGPNPMPP